MTPASAEGSGIAWEALPDAPIWAPPLADMRSPLTTLTLRFGDPLAIDAALAASFPLVGVSTDAWRAEVGLSASLFFGFQGDGELTFDFETFDGWFALPLDVASGPWAARLEWSHLSAHYGDGVRDDKPRPGNFDPWTRESVRLLGARALGPARLILGGGRLVHTIPAAPPWFATLAAEVEAPWRVAPYGALAVETRAEDAWSPAVSGQAGVRLDAGAHRLRAALAGRTGPEDTGKLRPAEERWLGVLFGFDTGLTTRPTTGEAGESPGERGDGR